MVILLRPDNCNGTYEAYCDPTREYTNITSIISESGRAGLLDYMKIYWKDYKGDDEDFWEHEWNKHGTCISTLEPKCYSNYASQQDVVDYFAKTVELFQDLDSYSVRKLIIHTTFTGALLMRFYIPQYLSTAGIIPSETRTYTAVVINAALKAPRKTEAVIQCKNGELKEIWYFYNVLGSVQTGKFVPANPGMASDLVWFGPSIGLSTTITQPAPTPVVQQQESSICQRQALVHHPRAPRRAPGPLLVAHLGCPSPGEELCW